MSTEHPRSHHAHKIHAPVGETPPTPAAEPAVVPDVAPVDAPVLAQKVTTTESGTTITGPAAAPALAEVPAPVDPPVLVQDVSTTAKVDDAGPSSVTGGAN